MQVEHTNLSLPCDSVEAEIGTTRYSAIGSANQAGTLSSSTIGDERKIRGKGGLCSLQACLIHFMAMVVCSHCNKSQLCLLTSAAAL